MSENFPQTGGVPPTGFDLLIAAIVRNPEDPPTPIQICGVQYVTPGNRWAAFTDDELDLIYDAFSFTAVGSDMPADDLAEEIEAETARREAAS